MDTIKSRAITGNYIDNYEWLMLPTPSADVPLLNTVYSETNYQNRINKWVIPPTVKAIDTLGAAITTTDGTSITVDHGDWYMKNMEILVDSELMKVSAISTNTLTVVRGVGDTTAATHLDEAEVVIFPPRAPEYFTAYPDNARYNGTAPTPIENYATQYAIDMSITEIEAWSQRQGLYHYNANDRYLEAKRAELLQNIQLDIVMGIPHLATDRTDPSRMGGIKYYLENNGGIVSSLSGSNLTYSDIVSVQKTIKRANGPRALKAIVDYDTLQKMQGWGIERVTTREDTTVGYEVTTIKSVFGTIDLQPIDQIPADFFLLYTPADINFGPVGVAGDSMGFKRHQKVDGSVSYDAIWGWYNLRIDNLTTHHALLKDWTAVSSTGS